MGAGGSLDKWIKGISELLVNEKIARCKAIPVDLFMGAFELTTSGGRTDLALVFNNKGNTLNIGKLAMWRLQFGSASWISDYLDNYANQHI